MKNEVLTSAFTVFFLFLGSFIFAQDLDLIVTIKEDSIACRIDSINDTNIYYEMKSQGSWIHTHINKSIVSEYKRNAIDKRLYNFKSGTSIITSKKPEFPASIKDIQKNSVYVGMGTLMYSRLMPLDKFGITLGGGIFNFDGWGVIGETTVLTGGGVKHFFEPGVMGFYFFGATSEPYEDEDDPIVGGASLRLGYRYQGPGGLLIRASPHLIFTDEDFYVFPALSIGYSF